MRKITFLVAAIAISFATYAVGMSGTYRVGISEVAPNFTSLKAAVDSIDSLGVDGDIILEITSDLTEPANIGLGVNTNNHSILIRPDVANDANTDPVRTITFTQLADNPSPTGHFVIGYRGLTSAWSDANTIATNNVTIDGYAFKGSTRRLIFTNTAANHVGARMIVVVGGCTSTTIKNCIINNLTTSGNSPFCVGAVVRKGTAIEVAPVVLSIDNNIMTSLGNSASMGMRFTYSGSGTITAKTSKVSITNNVITARRRLIELNYISGADIKNNEFRSQQTGAPGSVSYGIWTYQGVAGDFNITENKFLEAFTEETGASGSNIGHRVISLANGPNYFIANNFFAGLNKTKPSTAALNLAYIFYQGNSGKIYNNTFYMPALTDPSSTGYYSAIKLYGNTAEVKYNIFISDEPSHSNTTFISAVPIPETDYNIFHLRKPHTGATVVESYATLAEYQAANITKDVNSKDVDVTFENDSTGDLRIAGLSVQDINLKVPYSGYVPRDILGTVRNTEFTYAGAHESTLPFPTTGIDNGEAVQSRILRTTSGIEVQLNREATIELYTINGVMMDKARVNGTYSHELNSGVYIIRIDGKATKFVK